MAVFFSRGGYSYGSGQNLMLTFAEIRKKERSNINSGTVPVA
jgi:hypothetical protein